MNWLASLIRRARSTSTRLPGCRDLVREYLEAKRRWLSEFERLTIEAAPGARAAIADRFRLQIAYDERFLVRLDEMLSHSPTRIETNRGLAGLVASVDSRSVGSEAPELEAEIAALRSKSEQSIRDALSAAEARPEYRAALAALQMKMREIDARLAACEA